MKKIIGLGIAVSVIIALITTGTWALFSDVETSGDNDFQAGTIDLTIGGTGATGVDFTNMKPGDTASATITAENVGTLPGSLYASSGYVDNDMSGAPTPDMTADQFAKMLLITAFTADTVDILSQIPDVDDDSRITVFDMVNDPSGTPLTGYSDPASGHGWFSYDTDMTAAEVHTYALTLQFDINANNDYQGDGITWTFEFLLTQQP